LLVSTIFKPQPCLSPRSNPASIALTTLCKLLSKPLLLQLQILQPHHHLCIKVSSPRKAFVSPIPSGLTSGLPNTCTLLRPKRAPRLSGTGTGTYCGITYPPHTYHRSELNVYRPFIIGIEGLLEAEAASPGTFTSELHGSLEAVEKFRSHNRKGAYCAWTWFDGNDDIYYGCIPLCVFQPQTNVKKTTTPKLRSRCFVPTNCRRLRTANTSLVQTRL
jgi:hypothetical protein